VYIHGIDVGASITNLLNLGTRKGNGGEAGVVEAVRKGGQTASEGVHRLASDARSFRAGRDEERGANLIGG